LKCIEDSELQESADALEAAIARMPTFSWAGRREVEDERGTGSNGPLVGPTQEEHGLSITDLFSHSYTLPSPANSSRWLWVPKDRVLSAPTAGYLATKEAVW